jgi:hypothetical protein
VPAGWTIQQITHCSAGLACSDSLANRSSASALGEADLTTTATIRRQVGKALSNYLATIVDQFLADQATVDSSVAGVSTSASIGAGRAATKTLINYAPSIVDQFIVDQATVDGSGGVTTTASITATRIAAPTVGTETQDVAALVAAVGGGIGY